MFAIETAPIVFLDTNILWRDYLFYLNSGRSPVDRWYYNHTKIITFVKCVYEVWGLGKSATRKEICEHDSETDRLSKSMENNFINEFSFLHIGNTILSKSDSFSLYEMTEYQDVDEPWLLHPLARPRIFPVYDKDTLSKGKKFYRDYAQFRHDFESYLRIHKIRLAGYYEIFGNDLANNIEKEFLYFGELLEHINIPSEDLEIALAAISCNANYFVSEDKKLIKNWMSIGIGTHYPQPILVERENKWIFSKEEILTKLICAGFNMESLWVKLFLEYTESHAEEFCD